MPLLLKLSRPLTVLMCVLCLSSVSWAETRYVSDQLETTLRRGQGNEYKILRMLKSGTPVEVLEVNRATGYAHVKTASGSQGWMLSRYLMRQPSARTQLNDAESRAKTALAEAEVLRTQNAELQNALTQMTERADTLNNERIQLDNTLKALQSETADVQDIIAENRGLRAAVEAYQNEKDEIFKDNESLRDRSSKEWFVRGAGAVLVGVLLGILLPKMRNKRRRWGEM